MGFDDGCDHATSPETIQREDSTEEIGRYRSCSMRSSRVPTNSQHDMSNVLFA